MVIHEYYLCEVVSSAKSFKKWNVFYVQRKSEEVGKRGFCSHSVLLWKAAQQGNAQ